MIEKFESKVNDLKKKLGEKNIYLIFFVIFGIVMLFSLVMTNNYKRNRNALMDIYNKSMYELIGYVENTGLNIAKARITTSKSLLIISYSKIATYASLAKSTISSLPLEQDDTEDISKFLSQTSGYFTYLVSKLSKGEDLYEKDIINLNTINDKYTELTKIFKEIYNELCLGKLKWDEVEKVASKKLQGKEIKEDEDLKVLSLSKPFTEYAGLIYDGAFSNHLLNPTPKYLENMKEMSKTDCESIVKKSVESMFLDNKEKYEIEEITFTGESNGKLDIYSYDIKIKNIDDKITVQITKKGAVINLILWELNDKDSKSKNNTQDENNKNVNDEETIKQENEKASKLANKYLEKIGFENLEATYYINLENEVTINFAAVENNVLIYPDLIKVTVDIDKNIIVSIESTGYIFNHTKRKISKNVVSVEEAKTTLAKDINIITSRLCIIPMEDNSEILCYEFKGKIENNYFLIYVNAKTKEEENVLLLLETKGGTLTI